MEEDQLEREVMRQKAEKSRHPLEDTLKVHKEMQRINIEWHQTLRKQMVANKGLTQIQCYYHLIPNPYLRRFCMNMCHHITLCPRLHILWA